MPHVGNIAQKYQTILDLFPPHIKAPWRGFFVAGDGDEGLEVVQPPLAFVFDAPPRSLHEIWPNPDAVIHPDGYSSFYQPASEDLGGKLGYLVRN
jgi:hypothetical protein